MTKFTIGLICCSLVAFARADNLVSSLGLLANLSSSATQSDGLSNDASLLFFDNKKKIFGMVSTTQREPRYFELPDVLVTGRNLTTVNSRWVFSTMTYDGRCAVIAVGNKYKPEKLVTQNNCYAEVFHVSDGVMAFVKTYDKRGGRILGFDKALVKRASEFALSSDVMVTSIAKKASLTYVAYERETDEQNGPIFVEAFDAHGKSVKRIEVAGASARLLAHPQGLAMSFFRSDQLHVMLLNDQLEQKWITQIANTRGLGALPSLLLNGANIVYVGGNNDHFFLAELDASGKKIRESLDSSEVPVSPHGYAVALRGSRVAAIGLCPMAHLDNSLNSRLVHLSVVLDGK